jgi:CHAT domain-containing protein/Tfp pilus assembly protein PilF
MVAAELAWVVDQQGRFAEAEGLYRAAIERARSRHNVAALLNDLAGVIYAQGRLAESEKVHREALAIRQQLYGPEHEQVAQSLFNLANSVRALGRMKEADELNLRALSMAQKTLGPERPEYATVLEGWATVLREDGRVAESETAIRQVLAIRQRTLGQEHPLVAHALSGLALTLRAQGNYPEAERQLRTALEIQQRRQDKEHPDVADVLNNLSVVLSAQGRLKEAAQVMRQSHAITEKRLGTEHPAFASSLAMLAGVLHEEGQLVDAEQLAWRALALRQRILGNKHEDVASSMESLGHILHAQGKLIESEQNRRQALSIWEQQRGPQHLRTAEALIGLAGVLADQNRFSEAEPLYRRALEIRQNQLGMEHPIVAGTNGALAETVFALGKKDETLSLLRQSAMIHEKQLQGTPSEVRVESLLRSLRQSGEEDRIYSLALAKDSSVAARQLALTTALLRKGRSAEAGMQFQALLRKNLGDASTRTRYESWRSARQLRETLLLGGPGKIPPEQYRTRLGELQVTIDSLESQLLDEIPESRKQQLPAFEGIVSTVAQRLPSSGVLVEVVAMTPALRTADQPVKPLPDSRYMALILYPDQRTVVVDLGPTDSLNETAAKLWMMLRTPQREPKSAAQALYKRLMVPLLPHLQGITDLYLSLDHALNLIPFDALHDGKDYLLGRYQFHYLTSGRDLLRQPSQSLGTLPLVMADPDFGKVDSNISPGAGPNAYSRLAGLTALPGTRKESHVISQLLGVQPLIGSLATEERLRQAKSPTVLHIATHGLFLEDADIGPSDAESNSTRALVPNQPPKSVQNTVPFTDAWSPMARSALVLANARQATSATSSEQDGLLSAQEARTLDLESTQLVVLSACETGHGGLSAGQGVYGLRRAFIVAGAETVITSLWKVHDQATGELMTLFYQRLLEPRNPQSRREAMQQAMKTLRLQRGRGHPYYWAPFLVIGADGPVRLPSR